MTPIQIAEEAVAKDFPYPAQNDIAEDLWRELVRREVVLHRVREFLGALALSEDWFRNQPYSRDIDKADALKKLLSLLDQALQEKP